VSSQPDSSPAAPEHGRTAPERPPLVKASSAPVVDNRPPPILARLSQIAWVGSIGFTGFMIVYMFIIRETQLPLLAALIRGIDDSRADETYDTATDIIFWTLFGTLVVLVVVQIIMLMSMMNRRPGARWWQTSSLALQTVAVGAVAEFLGEGERGQLLGQAGPVALGLGVAGLLISLLPPVLRWSAARIDVRRGPLGPSRGSDF